PSTEFVNTAQDLCVCHPGKGGCGIYLRSSALPNASAAASDTVYDSSKIVCVVTPTAMRSTDRLGWLGEPGCNTPLARRRTSARLLPHRSGDRTGLRRKPGSPRIGAAQTRTSDRLPVRRR